MRAPELVSDRARKTPAGKESVEKVHRTACEGGTMIRISGRSIVLSPPLVMTGAQVETILASLGARLTAAA